jgi:NAD-dependent DNA ligase
MSERLHRIFNRARIDDRQVNELVGLARGIIADGKVVQSEAEYLYKWLAANQEASDNPIISNLLSRVKDILSDGILDDDEAKELFETLKKFSGGDFEIGELLKSTTLPFCNPQPRILFDGRNFCFTGTFAFGSRRECEAAVIDMGASAGSLTGKTDYLVIGVYATDSWAHSTYGRKIEKAVAMREKGERISIIGEAHWVEFLK